MRSSERFKASTASKGLTKNHKLLVRSVDMTKCSETLFKGKAEVDTYHVSFEDFLIKSTPIFLPYLSLFLVI